MGPVRLPLVEPEAATVERLRAALAGGSSAMRLL